MTRHRLSCVGPRRTQLCSSQPVLPSLPRVFVRSRSRVHGRRRVRDCDRSRAWDNRPEVTQCSVGSSTIDSGSTAAINTVIAGAMTCDEDVRLKAVYDAALSAWLKHRQGLLGLVRRKTTFRLRKQLLQSRWKAAIEPQRRPRPCLHAIILQ